MLMATTVMVLVVKMRCSVGDSTEHEDSDLQVQTFAWPLHIPT